MLSSFCKYDPEDTGQVINILLINVVHVIILIKKFHYKKDD